MATNNTQQLYFRRIIRITAEDSPNVRLARAQLRAGLEPTGELVVPGVLPWDEYQKRLATWDQVRQAIGLKAIFYEGAEVLLYPPLWLDLAEAFDDFLVRNKIPRKCKGIGIDTAQGGDETALCAVDEYGILGLESYLTPNTAMIQRLVLAFLRKYPCEPSSIIFDRGGGGKEHADYLRAQYGLRVRTVGFGDTLRPELKRGMRKLLELKELQEEKYVFKDRRSELYGVVSDMLDPDGNYPKEGNHLQLRIPQENGGLASRLRMGRFAIPRKFKELREEMALIPKTYDREGRLEILPKRRKNREDNTRTLTEIIGHSPDKLDAFALAVWGMRNKEYRVKVGAVL